ncbi:glycosyltransferase family 2 protein [Pedobacter suwonensis]|uniref:glycosyltransferase family 2 protein n=1 Tax=Pedobacter suwonensis TaxID=332999 RepID=UPI0016464003|nr:glycosyltransferase family 2 protein [Pedobacter suwonensis]
MKWIDRCLGSLSKSSVPVDIFIVDNNSSDASVNHIKENHRYLKLIESKVNLGFGRANNLGIEFAVHNGYDYVYLLNQDAWVFEDTLQALIDAHKNNDTFGVLSPVQMNAGSKRLDINFLLCCPKEILSDLYCNEIGEVYETSFVMAAHWLVSRECFERVGGFSISFPHYGEDHNYLHRAIYHGFKIGIVLKARAIHDREWRLDSKKMQIKKQYIASVVEISNLNNNIILHLAWQPFRLILKSLRLKSLTCFANSFRLVLNYPKLIKNRYRSKTTAFVDMNNTL